MGDVHNALKYAAELQEAIEILTGLDRSQSGLERLSESLTPVVDIWRNPEFAFLRGEFLWEAFRSQAAVAGEVNWAAVVNPLASQQLVIVEGVAAASAGVPQDVSISLQTRATIAATLASASNVVCRDSRTQTDPAATTQNNFVEQWIGSDPAQPANILETQQAITAQVYSQFLTPPYILRPGIGLVVNGGTVNTTLRSIIFGRVRRALPGELKVP